jgi:nucleoside 2-deoxyribosyltransferase
MRRRTVYLAGPDVFLPDAREVGQRKKQLCADHGFEGLYPLDEALDGAGPLDRQIYRGCVAMLRRADFGIVHLTPFRGIGADPGTVFELGALIALGKPAFGYTNVATDLLARVQADETVTRDDAGDVWRDSTGMMVEDFGNADNLMIDTALAEQGAPIVRIAAPPEHRFHDLAGFIICLERAVARFTAPS